MIDLAAASILARDLTEEHLRGGRPAPPPRVSGVRAERRGWIRRVASLLRQRSTEETWQPRRSPTSAC
jgi:hypothetical protein